MHSTKAKSISNATPKPRNSQTATAQGTNICILPDGKIEYIDELITFKNALQVELDHLIECAWATFTSHRQELTSPTYPLRDRLKLLDATVTITPLRFWHVDDELKKKLQTLQ